MDPGHDFRIFFYAMNQIMDPGHDFQIFWISRRAPGFWTRVSAVLDFHTPFLLPTPLYLVNICMLSHVMN